jgi:hypothetical protein
MKTTNVNFETEKVFKLKSKYNKEVQHNTCFKSPILLQFLVVAFMDGKNLAQWIAGMQSKKKIIQVIAYILQINCCVVSFSFLSKQNNISLK